MTKKQHTWQFLRVGGVNRVNLEKGTDLLHIDSLDQKLWTALGCPVNDLEIDAKTLQLIDTDNDGKIRVPEVIEAVKWILSLINNPDELLKRENTFPLNSINIENPLGKTLYQSAKQILKNLGKPDAEELAVEQTSDIKAIFANTAFNGDGIITELSTNEEETKELIKKIILCVGSVADRTDLEGISEVQLDSFIQQCKDFDDWNKTAEENQLEIKPFGDKTDEAYKLFAELKTKVEDYFMRCKLAEFDVSSAILLNTLYTRIESINNNDLSDCINEIAAFPLSKIEANKALSFTSPINPFWKEKLLHFITIVKDFLKEPSQYITEDEWNTISKKMEVYFQWKSIKTDEKIESLGLEYIRSFLNSDKETTIRSLIQQDKALEEEANNIILVDKLVRYYRDIYTLLNNFITFSDFYKPNSKGIFQAGILYFDQRSCDLCIKVNNMPKHNAMAANSGIYLVYFDCISKIKNDKITIVAAFTDGDVDNIEIGRNAIFYDNTGLDWDATIIKIIENPISIRQAFWSPYRKMSKLITKQINKIASSQDEKINSATTAGIEKTSEKANEGISQTLKPINQAIPETNPQTPVTAKPVPFDIAKFAGIFAAIGLAFGAIGSVLASVVGGFLALSWWKMPLAFLGIIMIISVPSMILAWLKLRKRNLAPILDANGWIINARATINIAFGATLTHLAKLPKNSKLNVNDPFTKKKNPLIPIIIIVILCLIVFTLWYYGYLAKWGIVL